VDANHRAELNNWLTHKVRPMFEQRVLAITEDIMFKWRLLVEDGRKARHTFSQPDLIIAATALHHGLTVVSRDVSDYRRRMHPCLTHGSIRRWRLDKRLVPRTQRSAPLFAAWCAAEPGPLQSAAFGTVPALRSGMKNAAPRPGHGSRVPQCLTTSTEHLA
jgi:hypothetical protein